MTDTRSNGHGARKGRPALPADRPDAPPPADDVGLFHPKLVLAHDPAGYQAEQYRGFRTNLDALDQAHHFSGSSRALLFASAYPEDGKSTTVANVGLCLAESGRRRVCIVDADLRLPRQHDLFGVDEGPGLADVLVDRVSPGKVLRATHLENLSLITAGREIDSVTEAINSEYLPNLIGWLKQSFDDVLVDSPPCIAYADAADMAQVVDDVVLVVQVFRTPKREARAAIERLEIAGARVLGTFVTGGFTDRKEPLYSGDDF